MDSGKRDIELLRMLWPVCSDADLHKSGGDVLTVLGRGEYNPRTDRFAGAEIVVDGVKLRGEVVIDGPGQLLGGDFESVVLQVVPEPYGLLLRNDGEPVPQFVLKPDPICAVAYESLKEGAADCGCAGYVARMEDCDRVGLMSRLLVERLEDKCGDIMDIFRRQDQNWNETMYVMLLRTMGDSKNKEAFTTLASKICYSRLARERNNIQYVEALLLGASGLLEMYDDDIYVRELKSDFEYLRAKYGIEPMMPRSWVISRNNPNNHPVLRIAQLAAFLTTHEFIFDNILRCRTVDDVHLLFRAEASQYWSTHFVPGKRSSEMPKRLGKMKAELLGINLVVPMMFAYGESVGDECLKEAAMELLEKIDCEGNRIIDGWERGGVVMENAFDSQAMLQLYKKRCAHKLCWMCTVGRRVVRKVYAGLQ